MRLLTPMLSIAIGLFIRYHIGRRRFNRRGTCGLQQFSSYGKAVVITAIEKLANFLTLLCLIAGILLIAVAVFIHFKF